MNALSGSEMHRAAGVAEEHAEDVDRQGRFPAEAIAALKADGWMSAMIPLEMGGRGLSLPAIATACNELARFCASSATIFAMHQIQVACLIRHALQENWYREFAQRMVSEQYLISSMTSEIGIGGNLRASLCSVNVADGRFNLEKRTPTMSYGGYADAYFASARSGPDAPPSDQVFVALLRPDVILEQTGSWDGLGLRGTCSGSFNLEATGNAAQIFPTPFAEIVTDTMLPVSHLLWAANWLGIAGNAVERARAYLRDQAKRDPNTQPHGAPRLARASGLVQMVQSRLRVALDRFDDQNATIIGQLAMDADLNALKHDGSRLCLEAVQEAMMICGMTGYRNGTPHSLGRHLRDIWSGPLMIGNDRVAANTGMMMLAQRAEIGGI
jgi:acyl-CoA dehydrogenase